LEKIKGRPEARILKDFADPDSQKLERDRMVRNIADRIKD
jgi:hypothetical protein